MVTPKRQHLIRRVDLFGLRLFLSAVEERQIGRAALREHIASSTATKRIQDLEEMIGVALLERTPHGVVATPAGDALVRCAEEMFASLDTMRAQIDALTDGMTGEVVIASARSIIVPFLARVLGDFAKEFPLIDVSVLELDHAEIVGAVASGNADIGVFSQSSSLHIHEVDVVPYQSERMVAILPRNHPLALRESVALEDLIGENVIAVGDDIAMAMTEAARLLGKRFTPRFNVKSAGVAISLVQSGMGVTVQPESLLRIELFDQITALRIAGSGSFRLIQVATPRGRPHNAAAQALLKLLLERPAPQELPDPIH